MTTITIKNGGELSRNKFQDLDDLRNYLISITPESSFQLSLEEEAELDRRYEEMKSGKEQGISLNKIRAKFEAKISS